MLSLMLPAIRLAMLRALWELPTTRCMHPTVRHTDKYGHVLFLKLLDGNNSVLPVYIGDFECAALVKEINKRQSVRDP